MKGCSLLILSFFLFFACGGENEAAYGPKPRMYPYEELPEADYVTVYDKTDCGFTFRKSTHALIQDRQMYFDDKLPDNCWFDLTYPNLRANIHFTYYPIGAAHTFEDLSAESFQMVYEHSAIASSIEEIPINQDGRTSGMSFELKGPVASPFQFFVTDTSEHFLRGALYFQVQPNPDSIAPVLKYIHADMDTLIKSIEWQ